MKLTFSRYPGLPAWRGDPCANLQGKYFWLDVDWNQRFPYGGCFGLSLGPKNEKHLRPFSGCLDLNAPLGEPDRLYLNGFGWHLILGLRPGQGCGRYRYHRLDDGTWERDEKPAPLHWGWLTLDHRRR